MGAVVLSTIVAIFALLTEGNRQDPMWWSTALFDNPVGPIVLGFLLGMLVDMLLLFLGGERWSYMFALAPWFGMSAYAGTLWVLSKRGR